VTDSDRESLEDTRRRQSQRHTDTQRHAEVEAETERVGETKKAERPARGRSSTTNAPYGMTSSRLMIDVGLSAIW
jgi:hypothetical protein